MQSITVQDVSIPQLGFGTWQLSGSTCSSMVAKALEIGYRHFDTARMYGNEIAIGEGLSAGLSAQGLDRGDIWVTTKIWPDDFADRRLQNAAAESIQELGIDQIDLLLLHWPNPDIPLAETMRALADTVEQSMVRHIGVSNFPTAMLREAIGSCPRPLLMNQVEYHPFLDQTPVLQTAAANGLGVTAYAPLAHGKVMSDDTLRRIGADHGKSPAQVALRWLIQQGVCAIPRSSKEDHARDNFAIWDFTLDDAEMAAISALRDHNDRLISPAGLAPAWD